MTGQPMTGQPMNGQLPVSGVPAGPHPQAAVWPGQQ
jgi:hypothetical protein